MRTQLRRFSQCGEGFNVGLDRGSPVTTDYPGASPWRFTGGTINLATAKTLTAKAGTLASLLTGDGSLSKTDTGTLIISGDNTGFAGATTIAGGTVTLGANAALGTGAVAVNAGSLDLNGRTIVNGVTVDGGTLTGGSIAVDKVVAKAGTIAY